MKIIKSGKVKKSTFGKLDEGDTFRQDGEEQIQIKTDEESGCCLEDGVLHQFDSEEEIIPITCELHING